MSINQSWMPLILGALAGLAQPSTWDSTDPAAIAAVLANVQDLLDAIGTAVPCSAPPPPCSGPGCAQQACNIAGYIATALIHDVVRRVVDGANQDQFIVTIISGLLSIIPAIGPSLGAIFKALDGLATAIAGPNLSHYEDALADPTLFGRIACAIYGCISTDGGVTDANFSCIVTAVGSVSYTHADVITAIAIYLGQIGAAGLESLQLPGVVAVYDCSGCPGGAATGPAQVLPMTRQSGHVSITIAAGTALGQAVVTFPRPFTATPVIVVSTDEQDLIASWSGATSILFTASLKAAVAVDTDTTADLFWQATYEGAL